MKALLQILFALVVYLVAKLLISDTFFCGWMACCFAVAINLLIKDLKQ